MIAVSVVVPVYNARKYIEPCVDSLLKQTLKDIEIILVDDGSTDGSAEYCDLIAGKNKQVTVIHQENQGASVARNTGISNASGSYIGFVDADDYVDEDMFNTLYNRAKEFNADIVFCNLFTNDQKMKPYLKNGIYSIDEIQKEIYPRLISVVDESQYGKVLRGAVWCKMFRRDLLIANRIRFHNDLIYNEDGLFSIQATLCANRYLYLGDAFLYHHVVVEESITKRYIDNLWDRQKILIDAIQASVEGKSYDFSDQIAKKMFDIAVYCIENEAKKSNKHSYKEKKSTIRTILSDDRLKKSLIKLEWKKMNRINKFYYGAMKLRSARIVLEIVKYRYRNNDKF